MDPGASNAPSDSSGPNSSAPGPLSPLHVPHPSSKPSRPTGGPRSRPTSPSPGLKPPASPPAATSDAGRGFTGKQLPLWDGKPVFTASLEPRPPDTATLLGCLHRFTRQESLGPREQWICARWGFHSLLVLICACMHQSACAEPAMHEWTMGRARLPPPVRKHAALLAFQ